MLWTLVLLGPPVDVWLTQLARQAGRTDLGSNAGTAIYGLLAVSAATVGAVLVFSSLQRYFVRGLTAGAVGG